MRLQVITVVEFPTAFDAGEEPSLKDIDKRSKDSAAMLDYWDKVDAITGGITTMRIAGEAYLPKFADEHKDDYAFRLKQTKMTNVYLDIIEGLSAKPFEEEITVDTTDKDLLDFAEDVDGAGNNITQFAAVTFLNGINNALDWIFIDYPNTPETIRTKAQQEAAGLRPFWSRVLARNMLEAKQKIINGKQTLVFCRILEPGTPKKVRRFERLDDGKVIWQLYKQQDNTKDGWILEDDGIISIGIIPLVPFITGRRDGTNFHFRPAMQGAVDLQIDLYEQESALKYAKVLTAFPILSGNGVTPEKDAAGKAIKLAIGPKTVLYAPMDGSGKAGQWSFVEITASSLKFLADDIKNTKQDLREIGRQPLTAQSGNLTVITTAVAGSKSKSAVVAWALSLKDTLENCFVITQLWMRNQAELSVTVYTEFDTFLDGEDGLDKLITMTDNGQLSVETLHHETKRRRYLSPEFDHDKEMERILGDKPKPIDDDTV